MIVRFENYIIIILLAVIGGMILGIIYQAPCKLHGPNAKKICEKIFYSKKLNKYVQFGVHPVKCFQKKFII